MLNNESKISQLGIVGFGGAQVVRGLQGRLLLGVWFLLLG